MTGKMTQTNETRLDKSLTRGFAELMQRNNDRFNFTLLALALGLVIYSRIQSDEKKLIEYNAMWLVVETKNSAVAVCCYCCCCCGGTNKTRDFLFQRRQRKRLEIHKGD